MHAWCKADPSDCWPRLKIHTRETRRGAGPLGFLLRLLHSTLSRRSRISIHEVLRPLHVTPGCSRNRAQLVDQRARSALQPDGDRGGCALRGTGPQSCFLLIGCTIWRTNLSTNTIAHRGGISDIKHVRMPDRYVTVLACSTVWLFMP